MKTSEVLKVLRISRPTLYKYRKFGKIKAQRLTNGHWDYDTESVYQFLNKALENSLRIYCFVSGRRHRFSLFSDMSRNFKNIIWHL